MSAVSYRYLAGLKHLPLYLFATLYAVNTQANIIINGTRVIYPESHREVNIQLNNEGEKPSLVQSWVDNGDPDAKFNEISTPFILTPPIVRIEPQSGQTLRLTRIGGNLPRDKESVFWLNVLDIPPKNAQAAEENIMQMAIRSRIKIFFRPTGLSAEGAIKAFNQLHWQRMKKNSDAVIKVDNPSGYFINIASIIINQQGKKTKSVKGEMISPLGTAEFRFTSLPKNMDNCEVTYEIVNDYGSVVQIKAASPSK